MVFRLRWGIPWGTGWPVGARGTSIQAEGHARGVVGWSAQNDKIYSPISQLSHCFLGAFNT